MPAVPPWLRGRNVGTFSITPETVASNGTLSDGSASSLTGLWESVRIVSRPTKQEISAADATRENDVIIKERTEFTINTILVASGTNVLAFLATTADYFKIILVRGPQTWTYYGVRGDYEETFEAGKSTGVITFTMVDPGAANPTYA